MIIGVSTLGNEETKGTTTPEFIGKILKNTMIHLQLESILCFFTLR